MNNNNIDNILKEAKQNTWPYPKTFEELKKSGVKLYTVNLDNYKAVYTGTFGVWNEPIPDGVEKYTISGSFSKEGIRDAIIRHAQKETTFAEFLNDIANCGVSHYKVDMDKRLVTYYSKDESNKYAEEVPLWNP